MVQPGMKWKALRRTLPFLGLLIVAGLIYDGTIFYSRWSGNRQAQKERAEKETRDARKTVDALGGDGLKILSFYAAPGVIKAGDHTTLCYGVSGAKTVRLEPPAEEVWPALTRCVRASPRRDTEYTLFAEDGAGHSTMESVTVRIR
jgi:hypothetical protein